MGKYTDEELILLLDELRAYPTETQWIEFKSNNKDSERIGKYISGLSNAACYCRCEYGYLVWGGDDMTHQLVGTDFDPDTHKVGNQLLRMWLKTMLSPEIAFEFHSFQVGDKRIVLLEIEAAYRQPVSFNKTPWFRDGSSLVELSRYPRVAAEIYRTVGKDWSAEIVRGASVADLDPRALKVAREQYALKHVKDDFAAEIPLWDDTTFLNKAKLAIDGKLTRAAILLLGKSESDHFIRPAVFKLTWQLVDAGGNVRDYRHYGTPALLAVDELLSKIRRITLRVLPDGTLFPEEIEQYEPWILREALHNCIAHQDYSYGSSVVVTEYPDHLQFSNAGAFFPVTIENALHYNGRHRAYPNKQLADAMVELKMIDTLGSGIKRMYTMQRNRFMPMPDYVIDEDGVMLTITGKVIDERYCRLLMRNADLSLDDVVLLDYVQKRKPISKDAAADLKRRKLIGGRYPHVYPALVVAKHTNQVEDYLEAKAFDDSFYMQHLLEFICAKGSVDRSQINGFLMKHMSSVLNEDQKKRKIGNLLSVQLRKRLKWIKNEGTTRNPCWTLTDTGIAECKKWNSKCKKCHKC